MIDEVVLLWVIVLGLVAVWAALLQLASAFVCSA